MSVEEAALVRQCLDGHEAALRALVERFQGDIFGLCVKILNHRQDAEDAAQEIFLRIVRSLHRWDSSRPLKPWIMAITVNRCRTLLVQRARQPELADYLHDAPARDERDDSLELASELRLAIQRLRPGYAAVFVMFHELGHSYDEIALTMEMPVGTVKTWLHRARMEVLDYLRCRGMMPDESPPAPSHRSLS